MRIKHETHNDTVPQTRYVSDLVHDNYTLSVHQDLFKDHQADKQ